MCDMFRKELLDDELTFTNGVGYISTIAFLITNDKLTFEYGENIIICGGGNSGSRNNNK